MPKPQGWLALVQWVTQKRSTTIPKKQQDWQPNYFDASSTAHGLGIGLTASLGQGRSQSNTLAQGLTESVLTLWHAQRRARAAFDEKTKERTKSSLDGWQSPKELYLGWTNINHLIMTNERKLSCWANLIILARLNRVGLNQNQDDRLMAPGPSTAINEILKHVGSSTKYFWERRGRLYNQMLTVSEIREIWHCSGRQCLL